MRTFTPERDMTIFFTGLISVYHTIMNVSHFFAESCDFEANVGSGFRTCYWYQSDAGVADWILTNQPIVPEASAGLTTDHSPTGNGKTRDRGH